MNHEELIAEKTNNDLITAIDIGTTKIVAIVGRKEIGGKIRIIGMASVPTPENSVMRGCVMNIEDVAQAIRSAVDKVESKVGHKFVSAFVGIAGQHISSQRNSLSKLICSTDYEIFQSDVDSLIQDIYSISLEPGQEIIHVIPQNFAVDNEIGVIKPVGMFGRKLVGNFHIVIGETNSAKNVERCVNRAGIAVSGLILEPLASAAAVLTKDEKDAGVALVDIGGGTTDIAVYHEGILQATYVLPYGGNVVTSDIKSGCNILPRHAEELKTKFGSALSEFAPKNSSAVIPGISGREPKEIPLKVLSEIIQARMEEIIDQVMFRIENSGYHGKLSAGIALTGGGSMLKNLDTLMKFRTGMDVRNAYPINYLSAETSEDIKNAKYSTSVGLLLEGMKISEKPMTLKKSNVQTVYRAPQENKETPKEQLKEPVITEKQTLNPENNEDQSTKDSQKSSRLKDFLDSLFDKRDTDL
jgi:cell division protein FtsA